MDGMRGPGWRWLLLLGVAIAVLGASWVTLRSMGHAFVAAVSWNLTTGPGTPVTAAMAFRQILVQDGVLDDALESAGSGPSSEGGAAVPEGLLDVLVGLGGRESVTVRLRVSKRTPWAAAFAAWDAARTLEAWDRRADSTVFASLITEADAAIAVLTEQIRIRQVLAPTTAGVALDADFVEREALVGFRDRLITMAAAGPSGLLRRVGTIGVSLAPGASPLAVLAALLMVVATVGLVVLSVRGGIDAAYSFGALRASRRVLATLRHDAPDHDEAVRNAIDDVSDAILGRRGDARCVIIVFTSPGAAAGKTRVACLVAEELARRAQRTLLVDAVLHAPAIADRYRSLPGAIDDATFGHTASTMKWLERPQEPHSITSVQRGDAVLDVIIQHQPVWLAPGTAGLLFDGARDALERWSRYQVVVIDAPALDADRGTDWLAPHATGIVIVLSGGITDRAWLKASRRLVHRFGRRVLGVVALRDEDAELGLRERGG